MDRPIDKKTRRTRLLRRIALPIVATGIVAAALVLVSGWISPSFRRADLRTGTVERGPVQATVTATGNVVPEYEHVICSPIDTRVVRILETPGADLAADQPILLLDLSETRLALDKLTDQIALKIKEKQQAQQDLTDQIAELDGREEIKALELKSLEFEAERSHKYFEEGLFSQDEIRKAENEAERARIELRQIKQKRDHATATLQTRSESLDLELSILQREQQEAEHRLELATIVADRAGALTWVIPNEGTAVRRGDELARVADLNSFRVEATVSEMHAAKVAAGQPVIIRTGDSRLPGTVANVWPRVENGTLTLDVHLTDNRNRLLRHNLRVEVYIVTAEDPDALRVPRGQFLTVDGKSMVFVLRDERALRTEVRFGLKNFEYYQVLAGLAEGDEVILSDTSDHQNVREVQVR